MKTAILFAGQGSQKAGMGRDIYEAYPAFAQAVNRAAELVDFDLKTLMFDGPETLLSQTEFTQPALAAFASGVTAVLKENNIRADYMAGLSLGEYSALHAAGVFDRDTLIRTTAFRGRSMQKCGQGLDTKMTAIIGLEPGTVEKICEEASYEALCSVEVSNYNAKGQIVVSGLREAVEIAEIKAKEAGAKRCMPLNVSSAFHTCFMEKASQELKEYFRTVRFGEMQTPVIFNVSGRPMDETEDIPALLELQVKTGVRMMQTIEFLKQAGVERIIEVGPGKTLSGFVRRTVSGIKTYSIDSKADLDKVIGIFGR